MNLLKTLWNKLVNKTSTSPTLVVVEEEVDVGALFDHICREAGVKGRDMESTNAVSLFAEWYSGPPDEESIRAAIGDFKKAHPTINAKLAGKL